MIKHLSKYEVARDKKPTVEPYDFVAHLLAEWRQYAANIAIMAGNQNSQLFSFP